MHGSNTGIKTYADVGSVKVYYVQLGQRCMHCFTNVSLWQELPGFEAICLQICCKLHVNPFIYIQVIAHKTLLSKGMCKAYVQKNSVYNDHDP